MMNCTVELKKTLIRLQKTMRRELKYLTLAQQLVAYGQHLHERPQLLVLGEELGQVLTATNQRHR
jgi:hypothetical protein